MGERGQRNWARLFNRFLAVEAPGKDGEWRAFCPFHEEKGRSKSPSASLNFDDELWHCMSCGRGGTLPQLARKLRRMRDLGEAMDDAPPGARRSRAEDEEEGAEVYDIGTREKVTTPAKPLPAPETLKAWNKRLLSNPRLLAVMTDERGLSVEAIKEFCIGHDGHRFTIPVYDIDGELVNIRRYDPHAKNAKDKMISWGAGWGKARIFRPDLLKKHTDEVIITEGEMDMIVAHQYGLPAVTHTAGAGTFKPEWAELFKGRDVFIAYDEDDTGTKGAIKAARILRSYANNVFIMKLGVGEKGGDVTDYFVKMGQTAGQFRELMKQARSDPFGHRPAPKAAPATGKRVTLVESQNAEYKEPLELIVSVIGKQTPPYLAPRELDATCSQDKGPICNLCPMMHANGSMQVEIPPDTTDLLNFVDAKDTERKKHMSKLIDARCSTHVDFDVKAEWTIEELIVSDSVEHRGEETMSPMQRPVYNVGTYQTPINNAARIVGRQVSDPKSGRGTFISWLLEETKTNIDLFEMSEDLLDELAVFQVEEGQSPLEKCRDIAADLSANVTRIYGREALHIAYDLVWHSVLDFRFMGKRMDKGWLECLVIGDTRTGKSEVAAGLTRHYNAGVLKSCEGATFAGIVGGAQQFGSKKHWTVTWGVIPLNDRRLVILDEMSGLMDRNVIENMSSIRSSGKAQLTKIASEETSARTRLIWISNPPDGSRLAETPGSAMTAMSKLVTNPEDIARFDFALAASGADVPSSMINSTTHTKVAHTYTSSACEKLVLWAWSRKADDIRFAKGVEAYVVEQAEEFGRRYVPEPPLVQVENVRMKLARIAVALAARTFSTDATGTKVIVKRSHVEGAIEFLDMVYAQEVMGYLRHSRRVISDRHRATEFRQECKNYLIERSDDVLLTLTSVSERFKMRDFTEFGGMDRVEAQASARTLLAWKMVRRTATNGYMVMTEELVSLLKELEDKDLI